MSLFVELDCAEEDWKSRLKENLQDFLEVNLKNFDYQNDGAFCELLALAHLIPFRIDYRQRTAYFSFSSRQFPNSTPDGPPPPQTPPFSFT